MRLSFAVVAAEKKLSKLRPYVSCHRSAHHQVDTLGTPSGRGCDRLLQLWQLLFAVRPKLRVTSSQWVPPVERRVRSPVARPLKVEP